MDRIGLRRGWHSLPGVILRVTRPPGFMGFTWRGVAVFAAVGAMALGCESPAPSSAPAASASAIAPPAADASGGDGSAPEGPAWLRFETPADAAPADVEALPLSPYRAGLLAKDVAARTSSASSLTQYRRTVVVAGTFVLAMADASAPIDAAADVVRRETAFLWRGIFARRLYEGVTVWVYGARDAYESDREKYGPRDSVASDLSFYDPETRTIWFCAAGGGRGTLGHETVHPLIQGYGDGDFPHAPIWLSEGLAALFEVVTYDDKTGDAQFGPHFRIVTLRKALKRTDYAPKVTLEHLFTLRDVDSFKKDRALGYALAREALRFMRERHGDALWRFYRGWRDGLLTDPTGERAFAAAMDGKTPADVTPEFLAWVQSSESGPL